MWSQRPWRRTAFPTNPRCSVSNPDAQQYHRDMEQIAFLEHQNSCNLRRAVIKAFPAILSNPKVWCRCISATEFDKAVSLARSARLTYKPGRHCNFDFELLTSLERDDVWLARFARNRELNQSFTTDGLSVGILRSVRSPW